MNPFPSANLDVLELELSHTWIISDKGNLLGIYVSQFSRVSFLSSRLRLLVVADPSFSKRTW